MNLHALTPDDRSRLREAAMELDRELGMRIAVYPRLIQQSKLTAGEANRRISLLQVACSAVRALANTEQAQRNGPDDYPEFPGFPRPTSYARPD